MKFDQFTGAYLPKEPFLQADLNASSGVAAGAEWSTEQCIQALENGQVEEFNANRPRDKRLDLTGIKVFGQNLAGVDLTTCDLTRASFLECNLTDANFDRSTLHHADLSGSGLDDSSFQAAKAHHIILQRIPSAENANFNSAELNHADMRGGSNFNKTIFFEASLHHALLDESYFMEADFTGAKLRYIEARKTKFNGAFLKEGDFQGATFYDTEFDKANLSSAKLVRVISNGTTSFQNANLIDSKTYKSVFSKQTVFDGAFIRGILLDKENGLGRMDSDRKKMLRKAKHTESPTSGQFKKSEQKKTTANLIFGVPGTNLDYYEEAMAELDALTGMDVFNEHCMEQLYKLEDDMDRRLQGLPIDNLAYHALWVGDAGTGKNTCAAIFAKLLFAFGVTKSPEMIYVKREELVEDVIGGTEVATREFVKNIRGKFVFVDEAYQLAEGGENDFGKRVLGIFLTKIENERDDWCSAWAGYPREMETFLKSNSGLRSRMSFVEFVSYDSGQLTDMLRKRLDKKRYSYSTDLLAHANVMMALKKELLAQKGKENEFGNAREPRTIYEEIIKNRPRRTRPLKRGFRERQEKVPLELLTGVALEDLPFKEYSPLKSGDIDLNSLQWERIDENGGKITVSYSELSDYLEGGFPNLSENSVKMLMERVSL